MASDDYVFKRWVRSGIIHVSTVTSPNTTLLNMVILPSTPSWYRTLALGQQREEEEAEARGRNRIWNWNIGIGMLLLSVSMVAGGSWVWLLGCGAGVWGGS